MNPSTSLAPGRPRPLWVSEVACSRLSETGPPPLPAVAAAENRVIAGLIWTTTVIAAFPQAPNRTVECKPQGTTPTTLCETLPVLPLAGGAKLMGVGSEGGLWRVAPNQEPCGTGMCGQGKTGREHAALSGWRTSMCIDVWRSSAGPLSSCCCVAGKAGSCPAFLLLLLHRWQRRHQPVILWRRCLLSGAHRRLAAGCRHGGR